MAQCILVLFELALDFDEGLTYGFFRVVTLLLRGQHSTGHVAGERDVIELARRVFIYKQSQEDGIGGGGGGMPIEGGEQLLHEVPQAVGGGKSFCFKNRVSFFPLSLFFLSSISLPPAQ